MGVTARPGAVTNPHLSPASRMLADFAAGLERKW